MVSAESGRSVVADLAMRTELLVRDIVIDVEDRFHGIASDLPDDVRAALHTAARAAGVFAPQVGTEFGGSGLNMRERLPIVEASGYSLFGPLALNCAAPDDGNIFLLEQLASAAQQDRYLIPLAAGCIRSCYVSTESAVVARTGRSGLPTMAERTGAGWVINGRSRFVRGAVGASVAIVTAHTSAGRGSRGGTTMFVVDADTPGYTLRSDVDSRRARTFGGDGELVFEDLEVGEDAVLGEVDRAVDYALARVGPVTLTACMHWMGSARRAADIAVERSTARTSVGRGEGVVEQFIVDNEVDILAARALVDRACLLFDVGEPSAQAISIATTFVVEAVGRVVDRSLRICGVLGVTDDAVLSRLHRQVRSL
ncbi:acyl-CoA dehydrogenase family protein [Nocardia salmonicida]|uniref:acyl-CoA dehydrogenase family protein n=1 Tax=Nocardia salmonicida TaxID=53431 RepID=UPI003CF2C618